MLRDTASSPVGLAKTGLAFNSAGAKCYYARNRAAAVQITLATQTVTGAYSSGGFVEVDGTNLPGLYRLDLPDAVLATGVDYAMVGILFTGVFQEEVKVDLLSDNPYGAALTDVQIADALLKRDMSAVTGEAARSPLNALRFLRNKWSISAGTLTVTKEDDATSAWTATVTGSAAVTVIDPA